jgi:hypothetical protein
VLASDAVAIQTKWPYLDQREPLSPPEPPPDIPVLPEPPVLPESHEPPLLHEPSVMLSVA